jgi:hypothetical protein
MMAANDGQPTEGSASGAQTTGDNTSGGQGKTYTDADMAEARRAFQVKADKAADRRAAELATQREADLLAKTGHSSIDELIAAVATKGQQASEEQKASELLKRIQRELDKERAERTKADETLKRLTGERNQERVRSAILAAADAIGAFPEDVFARLAIQNRVGVDDDGEVYVRDAKGEPESGATVERIVKELVAANEHLQRPSGARGAGSRQNSTTGPQGPDLKTKEGRMSALRGLGVDLGGR